MLENENAFNEKDNVFTVEQITNLIRTSLEGSFSNIIVKGEVSNYKLSTTGHAYFILKDNFAQISVALFKGTLASINFIPKDGMMVQIWGKISVYPQRGNYQLVVKHMEQIDDTGKIMQMIEERKRKLYALGYFSPEHKKKLPLFPKTIGIITSPTGAAIRDILQITKRRNNSVNVIIYPAVVQGSEAASSIEKMIRLANKYKMCDVLIVGRGGGGLEDLLPFSEENVVKAVYDSELPIVSAVGHDIDCPLCDFAADVKVSTPSAAAETVVKEKVAINDTLYQYQKLFYDTIKSKLEKCEAYIKTFTKENMENQFRYIEQPLSMRYAAARENLFTNMQNLLKEKKDRINSFVQILDNCNPQTVFDRGYAMVTDENGNVIRDAQKLKCGDIIKIKPSAGQIEAEVKNII